ncbi:bifunctional tetrahydrofolate synthase/dihydrofolate synthase [Nitrosomonas ureae]|uniref:Dihydrofolate synthase/folylpolyglutamate synthase n=1 Tax=Nitrosomonas ureae TaxID=44577 RepID=A0A0S3AFR8_9PROT|nr:bifunctional tetrahydrofolate synthase/dihydrofolate synthase [Nitrosomonas ureae]ALQ50039.1 bifunctional folylpolyglutamate synthase/dihydrofolate synthase [Nitrosomonas ureae]SDU09234.1 dihydrofolate synthase / folylpolyglutamate synthase [Nitrosomonas ureae]SEP97327.1 dihydrofolate synthase / folylpolyglutamate synthase [Nitrosomonas ureae]
MNVPDKLPVSVADWLSYFEAFHPQTIELGLDRINLIRSELALYPQFPIIIVGGTNGKGSVCAMLESILYCAGYEVGCYTSPHLLHYNERIRIGKKNIDDQRLCNAFMQIYSVCKVRGISLTYFEVGTLAAMYCFVHAGVNAAVLEVGLGGRLDAVNIFDADCSILTSIDLDHVDYLGDTREKIGFEKAAIFRKNKPAICAEIDLPQSVIQQAEKNDAILYRINEQFGFLKQDVHWDFWGPKNKRYSLPFPALRGEKQLQNASTCLAALDTLEEALPVSMSNVRQGLIEAVISGRFQVVSTQPLIILDVAHNPGAAMVLSQNLRATKPIGQTFAIIAMLQDKDIRGVIQALKNDIDYWFVSSVNSSRAAAADYLINELYEAEVADDSVRKFSDTISAFVFACEQAGKNDRICVFGSFYTVGDVLRYLNTHQSK